MVRTTLWHGTLALVHVAVLLPLAVYCGVLLHFVFPSSVWGRIGFESLSWPVRRASSWNWRETIAVTIVAHLFRAAAHAERIPSFPPAERIIPDLSRWAFGVRHQGWQLHTEVVVLPSLPLEGQVEATSTRRDSAGKPPLGRVTTSEALPLSSNLSSTLLGDVRGLGVVRPEPCSAIWLWKTQAAHVKHGKIVAVKPEAREGGLGCGPARQGEKVILYLAGCGYASNGPLLGPIAWTTTRQLGLRTLAVNYRKASSPSGAFPAGLQDALAAYCYLVDRLGFECKNIILLGDSAGAGLCVSLVLYLSMLAHVGQRGLARPGKVLLFSPWCDFTVPRDILEQSGKLDIIDFEGMLLERQAYLQHLPSTLPENDRQGWAKRASDETNELGAFAHQLTKTISILGASHPLISPGMPKSMSAYTERALQLLQSDEDEVGFFICAGGVDVHVNEARSLANNLADLKGVQVEYLEGQDKISSFPFVTSSVANATVDEKIHAFLAIS